jgi:DNA-binding MarR family transcriptional regulator
MKHSFIKEIRAFNRFYTSIIGVLDRYILDSQYSLPEARILFELYHAKAFTASDLISILDIDKGYLSRILKKFEKNKLICKVDSPLDRRVSTVQLTKKGKGVFDGLNRASEKQVEKAFQNLTEDECRVLVHKMKEIQHIIKKKAGK